MADSIVKEIFEERASWGGAKKVEGSAEYKKKESTIWPQHKEDNIDKIVVEQHKKGENYADWQKHRYPVKVAFPKWVHHVVRDSQE